MDKDKEDSSVCYCEAYNVTHSDNHAVTNSNLFVKLIQSGKTCKDIESYSVSLRKYQQENSFFLQFQKYQDILKFHKHELPLPGTCVIQICPPHDNEKIFEIYTLNSTSLDMTLKLSINHSGNNNNNSNNTQEDFTRLENALRTKLKVECFDASAFEHNDLPPKENCCLHITPHFLCVSSAGSNCHLYFLVALTEGADVVYKIDDNIRANDVPSFHLTFISGCNSCKMILSNSYRDKLQGTLNQNLKFSQIRNITCAENNSCTNAIAANIGHHLSLPNSSNSSPRLECRSKTNSPTVEREKPDVDRKKKPLSLEPGKGDAYTNGPVMYNNVQIVKNDLNLCVSAYATEANLTDVWALELIFLSNEDSERSLVKITESQSCSGRHQVLPWRPIKVRSGFVVVLEAEPHGFEIISGQNKHVTYDQLVTSKTTWQVVEHLIQYSGDLQKDVQFIGKVKLVTDLNAVNEEFHILQKFKTSASNSIKDPASICSPIPTFPLKYQERLRFCELLDMEDVFGKNWKYFASLMGLSQHEINVIETHGPSWTDKVLHHLETCFPLRCEYTYVLGMLQQMDRPDVVDLLVECNQSAVEHIDEHVGRNAVEL